MFRVVQGKHTCNSATRPNTMRLHAFRTVDKVLDFCRLRRAFSGRHQLAVASFSFHLLGGCGYTAWATKLDHLNRRPPAGSLDRNVWTWMHCMQLPEILFGNNALEMHHEPSGFILRFEARGALKQWVKLFSEGAFEVRLLTLS